MNVYLQEKDGDEWETVKGKVNNQINNNLKTMMLLKAQDTGIEYEEITAKKSRVQNFSDIGLAWNAIHCMNKPSKCTK